VSPCLLIADIGGTNARFAVADPEKPAFGKEMVFDCADFESAEVVVDTYLERTGAPRPSVICIAAAGPVIDGAVQLTNGDWYIEAAAFERKFPAAQVVLMNDFDAVAYSIPLLDDSDLLVVGTAKPVELHQKNFTIGVIGPGTGLGTAGLCRRGGRLFVIGGEGGHVGFAPETERQRRVYAQLAKDLDRVSDESLISGPGIVNIYAAIARIRGEKPQELTAAEVFELASNDSDAIAVESMELFFEVLGQVAGNLVLCLGAVDGVYIAGGIARRYPEMLKKSRFRAGFESKGFYRPMMESIPTRLIMHAEPGLLGASYRARQMIS
jgi:glucokinase